MTAARKPKKASSLRGRVLLFTQSGSERPKCVPTPRWMREGHDAQHVCEMAESMPTATAPPWMRALSRADRWWLVECENADAGRRVIEWHRRGSGACDAGGFCACTGAGKNECGAILASGGKGADK